MQHNIHDREDYQKNTLNESDIATNPIVQFERWFTTAKTANIYEPYAMTLATVNNQGQPSARIVLLRGFGEEGFNFFTNYTSRKGHDLAYEQQAALLFYWPELEQQIRIEGEVNKLSAEASDAYYHSRPVGNRLGAWASPQSQVTTKEALLTAQQKFSEQFGEHPPRPPHWGGYCLHPTYIEFWQGQPSRLHDRIVYQRDRDDVNSTWKIERLAP